MNIHLFINYYIFINSQITIYPKKLSQKYNELNTNNSLFKDGKFFPNNKYSYIPIIKYPNNNKVINPNFIIDNNSIYYQQQGINNNIPMQYNSVPQQVVYQQSSNNNNPKEVIYQEIKKDLPISTIIINSDKDIITKDPIITIINKKPENINGIEINNINSSEIELSSQLNLKKKRKLKKRINKSAKRNEKVYNQKNKLNIKKETPITDINITKSTIDSNKIISPETITETKIETETIQISSPETINNNKQLGVVNRDNIKNNFNMRDVYKNRLDALHLKNTINNNLNCENNIYKNLESISSLKSCEEYELNTSIARNELIRKNNLNQIDYNYTNEDYQLNNNIPLYRFNERNYNKQLPLMYDYNKQIPLMYNYNPIVEIHQIHTIYETRDHKGIRHSKDINEISKTVNINKHLRKKKKDTEINITGTKEPKIIDVAKPKKYNNYNNYLKKTNKLKEDYNNDSKEKEKKTITVYENITQNNSEKEKRKKTVTLYQIIPSESQIISEPNDDLLKNQKENLNLIKKNYEDISKTINIDTSNINQHIENNINHTRSLKKLLKTLKKKQIDGFEDLMEELVDMKKYLNKQIKKIIENNKPDGDNNIKNDDNNIKNDDNNNLNIDNNKKKENNDIEINKTQSDQINKELKIIDIAKLDLRNRLKEFTPQPFKENITSKKLHDDTTINNNNESINIEDKLNKETSKENIKYLEYYEILEKHINEYKELKTHLKQFLLEYKISKNSSEIKTNELENLIKGVLEKVDLLNEKYNTLKNKINNINNDIIIENNNNNKQSKEEIKELDKLKIYKLEKDILNNNKQDYISETTLKEDVNNNNDKNKIAIVYKNTIMNEENNTKTINSMDEKTNNKERETTTEPLGRKKIISGKYKKINKKKDYILKPDTLNEGIKNEGIKNEGKRKIIRGKYKKMKNENFINSLKRLVF